jgi:hypothetical protein
MNLTKEPKGSTKAQAIRFVTTDGQKQFNSEIKTANYPDEATTTQLTDITDPINTSADKVLGRMVLNASTGVMVFASGNTDGAVWHFYDSTTAHTPV